MGNIKSKIKKKKALKKESPTSLSATAPSSLPSLVPSSNPKFDKKNSNKEADDYINSNTLVSYKEIGRIRPLSGLYTINALIKINENKFIASGGDGTIGLYTFGDTNIECKPIKALEWSYYLIRLSDNRFLNCGLGNGMTVFSLNTDNGEYKIEQEIPSENEDPIPMCIELSNGNLISASCFKGSLSIWTKKDNKYILLKKVDKILGEDGICLFEVSKNEIVATSTGQEFLFVDSNSLEIKVKIPQVKSAVSNTSGICKIAEDVLAVGGGYGSGIYLISISKRSLIKQIKLDLEKDVNCIYKLKNGVILTCEYYQSEKYNEEEKDYIMQELVDIEEWRYDEKNKILKSMDLIEAVDVASIRSIIERDNDIFITGSLSGMIRVWQKSGTVLFL